MSLIKKKMQCTDKEGQGSGQHRTGQYWTGQDRLGKAGYNIMECSRMCNIRMVTGIASKGLTCIGIMGAIIHPL